MRFRPMLSLIRRAGDTISTTVATFAGHPLVQAAVLVGSVAWLLLRGSEAALASAMTIGGFVLTQMVLNQQRRRENALHLKIDEILLAMHGTRNEVAGVEREAEEEIERLRAGRDAEA